MIKQKIKNSAKKAFGILLILIGIAGLFLPLIQGIFLIFLGILLLSPEKGKKLIEFYKQKRKNFRKSK